MSHIYDKFILTSLFLFISGYSATAQKSNYENAPYSKYGLGERKNSMNTVLRGMGSISSAYAGSFVVNTDNPASYASLKLTTYEVGGEARTTTIVGGNEKYRTGTVNFSYMNIGIPVGKKAGISFGLLPQTRMYYRLDDSFTQAGFGNGVKAYVGDGALNFAYIGAAYKFKGVSLGVNFGYNFGSYDEKISVVTSDASAKVYESEFARYDRIGGIYWKTGLMYETKLKKDLVLRAGATATLSQDLKVTREEYWISHSVILSLRDTAYHISGTKSTITLPLQYSAGVQIINSDKWLVGADFSAGQWSQFRRYGITDSVNNCFKISVGGEITPDASNMRKYRQRITYRLGLYYGTDFVYLRNTSLNYYAVTAGASLPFKRTTDRLHLNLEVGSRGTQTNGLMKETFVRLGVGITLNDRWFVKRPLL